MLNIWKQYCVFPISDLADTIRQKQSELTKIDKKSMQTKLLPDGSRAKYECPVCNQCMFGKTNVLAEICGHVVCKACVIGVIDTNYYHCPKCRIGNISKQIPVFIEEPTYNLGEDSSEDENVSWNVVLVPYDTKKKWNKLSHFKVQVFDSYSTFGKLEDLMVWRSMW